MMRLLLAVVCLLGCSSSSEQRTLLVVADGGGLDAAGSGGASGAGGSAGRGGGSTRDAGMWGECESENDCMQLATLIYAAFPDGGAPRAYCLRRPGEPTTAQAMCIMQCFKDSNRREIEPAYDVLCEAHGGYCDDNQTCRGL